MVLINVNMKCVNIFLENDQDIHPSTIRILRFGHFANINVLLGQDVHYKIKNRKVKYQKMDRFNYKVTKVLAIHVYILAILVVLSM